jgi:hypothetical protein
MKNPATTAPAFPAVNPGFGTCLQPLPPGKFFCNSGCEAVESHVTN